MCERKVETNTLWGKHYVVSWKDDRIMIKNLCVCVVFFFFLSFFFCFFSFLSCSYFVLFLSFHFLVLLCWSTLPLLHFFVFCFCLTRLRLQISTVSCAFTISKTYFCFSRFLVKPHTRDIRIIYEWHTSV